MTPVIETVDLRKVYSKGWGRHQVEALKGVSLSISEGETFGFIGPNGAGKSTLIKILVGVLRASEGQARLFGKDARDSASRRGLGFVPENPSLQDFLTPLEILLMGVRLHRLGLRNEREHCIRWLERFDLGAVSNRPLRGFSKGMMQRTALAHAMAVQPRLLILDEPLSGLDPVGRKDVVDILDDYRRGGGTLFFSSHVLYDVERIADRFGLIHKGRLLTVRSPQDLVADQADRYVLRYRGEVPVAEATLVRSGLFSLEVSSGELASAISAIQSVGGMIQDVLPKASLEAVFFKTIES